MDLTTHCPQCASAFLVSEDQLDLAQGWVRCGVCHEVFMARAHTAPVEPHDVPVEPLLQRPETLAQEEPMASQGTADPLYVADSSNVSSEQAASARATGWRNGRLASFGVLLCLLTALAAQAGLDAYRNLADVQPTLAYWVQFMCPPTRCALRQGSALGIDDSSLTAAGDNAFHLQAMISNRSGLTLEAPSLALTLTDGADEVLARKIYAPKEWAAQTDGLTSASTTPVDLWVRWDDVASTSRVAGYRLQVFYP